MNFLNRKTDNDASESSGHGSCCPHVVDPWLFIGILAGIAITTFLLRMQIIMFIMGRRRRKRNVSQSEQGNSIPKDIDNNWSMFYAVVITGRKTYHSKAYSLETK